MLIAEKELATNNGEKPSSLDLDIPEGISLTKLD
jgi:hypothetical protein